MERLETTVGGEKQIFALLDSFFDWAETHQDQGVALLLLYYLASHRRRYRELHTRIGEWTEKEMSDLSHAVWAVIDGFMVYYLSSDPHEDPQFYRKQARLAVAQLIR